MSAQMFAAAVPIAIRPLAQCQSTAGPDTWVIPVATAAYRARAPPPYIDSPETTSSKRLAATPERRTASSRTWRASSSAGVSAGVPLNAVPIEVL
jgi:hypothetical protein